MNEKDLQTKKEDGKSGRHDEAFILLVQQASKGNREALVDLCKNIAKGTLFRTTYILGNQTDAEDVTQEVMLSVCSNIHELREPKAFYVWLNRIIINETNRYLAKKTRHGVLLNIEDYQENINEEDDDLIPQEYAMKESDRRMVMEIIDGLPEQQRKAVLLHYYDGLTLVESAKVMNVSQPRVSRCLKFAQEKIRKEIAKRAKKSEEVAYGLAMMPIGPMLTQVMQQEAAGFPGAHAGWMQDLINNAATIAESTTTVAAAAGATATAASAAGIKGAKGGGAAAAAANPAGIVATVAAAVAVSVGVLVAAPLMQEQPEPPPIVAAEYEITFSGGTVEDGHINPSKAVAHAYTPERGDMTATEWRITSEEDDTVLYSGSGGVVDDAFAQMKANSQKGSFILSFDMKDNFGENWTLSREFTII